MKKVGFFSLGDLFIGNGMGKWGGENSLNTFGNMHHPNSEKKNWKKKYLGTFWTIGTNSTMCM